MELKSERKVIMLRDKPLATLVFRFGLLLVSELGMIIYLLLSR